jgi:hypothetical protein
MDKHAPRPDMHSRTVASAVGRRACKVLPIIAVLTLGLALSACDHCGDFFWQSGACHATPPAH